MICDGAKASCAAKIASAVEAGLLGWQMQTQGSEFFGGDGKAFARLVSRTGFMLECSRDGRELCGNESDENHAEPDGPGVLFVSEGI